MPGGSASSPEGGLTGELVRARAREAAAREILELISQSRDDAAPVFDAILHRVADLCDASAAALILGKAGDTHQRIAASHGVDPATTAIYDRGEVSMDPDTSTAARAILSGKVIHVEDQMDTEFYRQGVGLFVSIVRDSGIRTEMLVPLLTPTGGIGAFVIFRKEVRPFSADEIALAETFAAQAVIAIENVRQFRELQTRLEREKASSEILQVISQSRDDEGPVFDVIAQRAAGLCGAAVCTFWRVKDGLIHYCASHGLDSASFAETRSTPSIPLLDSTLTGQVVKTRAVVRIEDATAESYLDHKWARRQGLRQLIGVPILIGDEVWGSINLMWPADRAPGDADIQLVETFAAQASIAIENVRQFRELQTRLAREAATREILEVISQSRDDDRPVFDMVLRKAAQLCGASLADLCVISEDRSHAVVAAHWGEMEQQQISVGDPIGTMDSEAAIPTCMREGRIVDVDDLADTDLYRSGDPIRVTAVDKEGIRTFLAVPLLSGGRAVGCIAIYRLDVRPFSADQITLVETFAAQAVIAIENVRQFRELQSRLAREAAAREILEVISQSRDDEKPVFGVLLRKAAQLCGAPMANLSIITDDGNHSVNAAQWGEHRTDVIPVGSVWPLDSPYAQETCMREGRIVHIHDLADTDLYLSGDPVRALAVDKEGVRTFLSVPLVSDGRTIGCISTYRHDVRPFTPDEITLVETFAAQAVIAIENVRQFRELQSRLEREAATRNILRVISVSRDDEQPTFEAILDSATRLCGTPYASLVLGRRGDALQSMVAHRAASAELLAVFREGKVPMDPADSIAARSILEGRTIHVPDMADTDQYRAGHARFRMVVDRQGLRTNLFVPLLGPEGGIGCLILWKKEVAPFTADQISLMETFAAHAVIAIENVRQFRELQDSLEQQEATSDILRVISQSREDETQVFDLILEKAAVLCDADQGSLQIVNEARTHVRLMADWGHNRTAWQPGNEFSLDLPLSIVATIRTAKVVHIEDYSQSDAYKDRDPIAVGLVETEGHRTRLIVPLLQNGIAIGCISLSRRTVRPFTPDEIALVETFAAQAVIAIENVRQFRELQTRLAREAATREILEVISRNPDDDRPVFDAILGNAIRLCGADTSALFLGRLDDQRLVLAAWRDRAASSSVMEDEMIAQTNATPMLMDPTVHVSAQAIIEECNFHIPDVQQHPSYLAGEPSYRIMGDALGIRSALVVPLIDARGALGVVQVHRREVRPFTDDEIALVETFAAQAVIAIENVRQFKALEALNAELGDRVQVQVGEIERMGRLKRFLPAAVADAVVTSGSEKLLSSHRALLGVLFCDIRGFTAFCETAEPEETIEVLQTYHEEMGKLINAHGAGVDHRMGDGIMVLFNDPLPCDDPAGDAVRLAMAMRTRMAELAQHWKRLGHRLGFGVGVSLGYATVGMVGFEGRFDYTASGTAINLASRLCDEAHDGEILLSPRASIAVEDRFQVESRGEITLKGIREPVEVFRLTGGVAA